MSYVAHLRQTEFDSVAAGLGFEPKLPGPKPGVLPLDDPAMFKIIFCF